ncbi:MAG TPA: hypothetical protein VG168_05205 [Bryobacteraceae bacterium]|jgi:hypothetical protein|nr:hypothetical protein [Bryobacteraceae bacterium]
MNVDDSKLDGLFQLYGRSCPEVEPSANFMPVVWQKIEARRSFSLTFQRVARALATVSVGIGLLLAGLNMAAANRSLLIAPTYADALAADHTVEKTYYTEAIRPIPPTDSIFAEYR